MIDDDDDTLSELLREVARVSEVPITAGAPLRARARAAPPTAIGPYAIEALLGAGGMGVVYRARAPDGAPVAVKVLLGATGVGSPGQRFAQEGAVRVEHPNVVRVLDVGSLGEAAYLVLELLDGESLEARLRRGPLAWRDAVALVAQACRGLEAVHARGIVHRDLKPANLFVTTDGVVKVLDFGVARDTSRATRLTAKGAILGSPAYLSPEQARGELDVDARADLWALGVVLYEALCGSVPFARPTVMATVVAVLFDEPPPLRSRAAGLPQALCSVVERCLQKAPQRRWTSAAELRAELEQLADAARSRALVGAPLGPATTPPIAPGEQRLIVLLLAHGVRDLRAIADAVEARGGVVSALLGERAIGVFGAERWEGDEAARAAGAALRCRFAARSLAIASGHASSREGLVSGIAVERAELACAASLDGIAVHPETGELLAAGFSLRRRGPLLELVAERPAAEQPAPDARRPTFGRETEVAQLRVVVEAVLEERRAASVLIVGAPGAGKTHLLGEARALLEAPATRFPTILAATALPLSGGTSLALLRGLLERRAAMLHQSRGAPRLSEAAPQEERRQAVLELAFEALADESQAREHAVFLGELLGVTVQDGAVVRAAQQDPQLMADRLRLALFGWLGGLLARGPVALLLEDAHWADAASLSMLEEMLVGFAEAPLLVVTTARPELDARLADVLGGSQEVPRATRVALRGLSATATRLLGETVTGRALSEELAGTLHAHTGGNPLFVAQIAATLRETGQLDHVPARLPLPLTVEAAAQSRLDHLSPAEKDLCRRAAVFGRSVTSSELAALGVAEPDPLLASLVRRDLLVASGGRGPRARYQFRSPLVMEVAYGMLDEAFRTELHARAGECLEASREAAQAGLAGARPGLDPEEVARHLELGARAREAARWYLTATRDAGAHADSSAVLRASERALALGAGPAAVFELRMARAEALRFLGRRAEQGSELDLAERAAASAPERARVLSERVAWLTRVGRAWEAVAIALQAVAAAEESGERDAAALALGRRAEALMTVGAYAESESALDAATAQGALAPRVAALLAAWRARLAAFRGDVGQSRAAYALAARLHREAGDVRRAAASEVNAADAHNRFGDHETARRGLERALGDVRRLGVRVMEGYALVNLGYARLRLADVAGAERALADAAALASEQHNAALAFSVHKYQAWLALATGRTADALAHAEASLAEAARSGQQGLRAIGLAAVARVALEQGEPEVALARGREAMLLRRELGGLEEDEAALFLSLAAAERRCGLEAEAAETLAEGRRWLRGAAERITDPEWRRRFLQDVPEHRALLDAAAG